jgi:ABC-type dipeptide/oligopeptide/nickel transport system permease component
MSAAMRPHSRVDNAVTGYAVIIGTIPSFVMAFVLVYFFAVKMRWFPAGGWGGPRNLILPSSRSDCLRAVVSRCGRASVWARR